MKIAIIIISFFLDGILSNVIKINGILYPLFSLVCLIAVHPYFNYDKKNFYKYAFFTGLAYDLVYTNTFVFYACLFFLLAFTIDRLSMLLEGNYFSLIVITLICIILFRSVSYLLIVITGNIAFDLNILIKGIYSSVIINIIYIIFVKIITDYISKKYNIKKSSLKY